MSGKTDHRYISRRDITLLLIILLIFASIITLTIGEFKHCGDTPSWSGIFYPQSVNAPAVSGSDMYVHAIDVGQGDCVLVQGGGANILIDAGDNGKGEVVVRYLDSIGVRRLDLAICSHTHNDHIGGMDYVISCIPTDAVIMPDVPPEQTPTTRTYSDLLDAIDAGGSELQFVTAPLEYSFGKMSVQILSPMVSSLYTDGNDYSIVSRFVCADLAFLCCGDITAAAEKDILTNGKNISAQLFKLSHHGSGHSNTEDFLKAVSPSLAFIQCGRDNDFGHPHPDVTARLRDMGIHYYRTDLSGTIVFYSNGSGFTVKE